MLLMCGRIKIILVLIFQINCVLQFSSNDILIYLSMNIVGFFVDFNLRFGWMVVLIARFVCFVVKLIAKLIL